MAFLAAAPAILGGMTVGTAVALGAAGAMSARQSYIAGKHEEIQSNIAAQKEADAGRQQEIARRRDLMRALAAKAAYAGATGVTTGGSIESLINADIRDAQNDLLVTRANTQSTVRGLRVRGSSAKQSGYAGAATSLLDTASTVLGFG